MSIQIQTSMAKIKDTFESLYVAPSSIQRNKDQKRTIEQSGYAHKETFKKKTMAKMKDRK